MEGTVCPECGQPVVARGVAVGQRLICPYCRTRLEVIEINPLELDWAYDEPTLPWEDFEGIRLQNDHLPDEAFG